MAQLSEKSFTLSTQFLFFNSRNKLVVYFSYLLLYIDCKVTLCALCSVFRCKNECDACFGLSSKMIWQKCVVFLLFSENSVIFLEKIYNALNGLFVLRTKWLLTFFWRDNVINKKWEKILISEKIKKLIWIFQKMTQKMTKSLSHLV